MISRKLVLFFYCLFWHASKVLLKSAVFFTAGYTHTQHLLQNTATPAIKFMKLLERVRQLEEAFG
jgi:hypothetical protein